jgi:saccharopepsin
MKHLPTQLITLYLFSLIFFTLSCNNKPAKETASDIKLTDTSAASSSVKISYFRSKYQIDGASPWYGMITVGSNNQAMRVGLDCGNNANWLTSTQCISPACMQLGRTRFNYAASTTFSWINKNIDTLAFGPWGNMTVNIGQDVFNSASTPNFGLIKTLLSVNYNGPSFAELDWDGGIGFPSQSPDSRTTWLLLQLVNKGLINPNNVCVSFYMNPVTKAGVVNIGGYDPAFVDPNSKLRFPFKPYTLFNGALNYLWSTRLSGWYINGQKVSNDSLFVFDTGASDFKGDTVATDAAITAINNYYNRTGNYPVMGLAMGIDQYGRTGKLNLTTEQYLQKVEKGPRTGQTVIAIDTLEVPGLILAGSVVLEDLYTVFWYKATGNPGNYLLTPVETWLFNKKDGPVIIQNGLKTK